MVLFLMPPVTVQGTKIRPLWGTAQLFMHPRYMHGGATRYSILDWM